MPNKEFDFYDMDMVCGGRRGGKRITRKNRKKKSSMSSANTDSEVLDVLEDESESEIAAQAAKQNSADVIVKTLFGPY